MLFYKTILTKTEHVLADAVRQGIALRVISEQKVVSQARS